MAEWIVLLDSPTGFNKKLVRVYLENDSGGHRQIERVVAIGLDVDAYITENFEQLWGIANPLADDVWDAAFEVRYRDLYRDVVRAGVVAARGVSADLVDVTDAMEAELLASDKSGAYTKLKTLASGASAVQRDALFAIVSFLVLNEFLADD